MAEEPDSRRNIKDLTRGVAEKSPTHPIPAENRELFARLYRIAAKNLVGFALLAAALSVRPKRKEGRAR